MTVAKQRKMKIQILKLIIKNKHKKLTRKRKVRQQQDQSLGQPHR